MTNLKPIRDRILVKPSPSETATKSGIIIPDAAQEKPLQGQVVMVGSGRITDDGTVIAMEVKEGDTVLYGAHSGQTVKTDGVEYIVLKEDDILAIVE